MCDVGQGQGEQEQQLRSELSMEKAQMRRQHERELKALSDKMADEQVWPQPLPKTTKLQKPPGHIRQPPPPPPPSAYTAAILWPVFKCHVCGGKSTCRAAQVTGKSGCA